MNLNKPKFWDSETLSIWSILLLPLTAIYLSILLLKKKITKENSFNIQIICVGNIYIGGTGKTPLVIKLNSLLENKRKILIIKKNYPNQQDEINLLKKYCKVSCESTRELAINNSIQQNFDLAILDDGFQDTKIKKDYSILCFSSAQGIGNGFVLPSGPLREPLKNLQNADLVVINGQINKKLENTIKSHNPKIEITYSHYKILNKEKYINKNYYIFSGIGNNINFLNLLKNSNISVIDYQFYPDHYSYTSNDLEKLKKIARDKNLILLTTEKDFLRIDENKRHNIEYLSAELEIQDEEKLVKRILNL